MNKLKFNSQVCTTREQSEKLLALGLKPETADCHFEGRKNIHEEWEVSAIGGCIHYNEFPAWSLHRLIEMLPADILPKSCYYNLIFDKTIIQYESCEYSFDVLKSFGDSPCLYNNIIDSIEWLIKENYFNKEYLKQ